MPALDTLNELDIANSLVSLWVFKGPTGAASEDPKYTGRWVEATNEVIAVLKEALTSEIQRLEEVRDYGLLAENNEASALRITTIETHAGRVIDIAAAETQPQRASNIRHLQNAKFYLVKFIDQERIIHAVKKTESSWTTKKARSMQSAFFLDNQLGIDNNPRFDIANAFDFIVVDDEILCLNKRRFESILRYKQAHKDDFAQLKEEQEFVNIFSDISPIVDHIGENKIQLRRASAIRMKGHYRDREFMQRLRDTQADFGFNIQFDEEGKIVASPESCSQIMTALLDHRLASGFSKLVYDVQNTTPVTT